MRPHPILYQLNTSIFLNELGRRLGRQATYDDVPEAMLDTLAERGFDVLWLLGTWSTSPASRKASRSHAGLRGSAEQTLPDLTDDDICGSPFAIDAYEVRPQWGGNEALARLRRRLAARGIMLLLDFVPNHTGLEHPWVNAHPDYFIRGTARDVARAPENYARVTSRGTELVLAHGKDPYFPGWPDTLQLDYRNPAVREAMQRELLRIAELCDGVRCDMAMLIQPDVFAQTWGDHAPPPGVTQPELSPFWPHAIEAVRRVHPGFVFVAEVYWNRERELQHEGFDFTYDKTLYDRLREGVGHRVREHLCTDPSDQARCVRFIENHDEPRAAAAFPLDMHRAAAMVTFFAPGLRLLHDGQLEGRRVQVSMHVDRRPDEPPEPTLQRFYARVLACLRRPEVRDGRWTLHTCRPARDGDDTWRDVIVMSWTLGDRGLLVAVNYAARPSQCRVALELPELRGRAIASAELSSDLVHAQATDDLLRDGLHLDLPPWGHRVFELRS